MPYVTETEYSNQMKEMEDAGELSVKAAFKICKLEHELALAMNALFDIVNIDADAEVYQDMASDGLHLVNAPLKELDND